MPTVPVVPLDTSHLVSTLARDWAVQANTGTKETPVWVFVYGLSSVNPTTDLTMQDDGDIHAGGYKSQMATAIGSNLELQGMRKGELEGEELTPDAGQEFLRAKGQTIGYNNVVHMRVWRTDGLPDAFEQTYAVNWTDTGGDKEGLQGFTCTCTGRGKPTPISKPTVTTP
ncbi:phage tail tube protein [Rhodococcus opacus]|uniref:phage tail tube protein n=1 Tax=Rhodococcus opacus TaxID=37919 RepID=UPI001C450CC4|nr:hypothetical protein [Rhodococcus opacus]MBV6758354.1 hypothetical protein [Rhodococcus opacus]